ncbi:MAG: hypothetical protein KF866_06090 [Phycisphaeraceae bacterium]|nr:hypothetical protein [Phycisphaeraceae bacterium]
MSGHQETPSSMDVDHALDVLAQRRWSGPLRDVRIEEHMMNDAKRPHTPRIRRSRWLVGALVLTAGGAVAATTGAIEWLNPAHLFRGQAVVVDELGAEHVIDIQADGSAIMKIADDQGQPVSEVRLQLAGDADIGTGAAPIRFAPLNKAPAETPDR